MNKKIMILGASILQLPAIEQAKKMGLTVIVVDMNPDAIGFKVEGIKKEIISTINISGVLEAAKRHRIDGIMTLATDMPMQTVATVAAELGLVGITRDTAIKATNKGEMRVALREANVPIPMFYRVSTKEEYKKAIEKIKSAGYRCIVKPADNSGSRGIDLLKDFEKDTIEKTFEYSKQSSRRGDLMIEEYMEGPEVSVETLSIDGICHVIQITDKLTTGAPYFVEMGHSQPSAYTDEIKQKIAEIAIEANRAIGIKDGPSHTEIKITKDGPKVVEIGARLGGDNITTHLVPLSTGVNLVECCIKVALGEKPNIKPRYQKAAAIRYIKTGKGIIEKIEGIEDAKKIPGIQQISIVHGIGECVEDIRSSTDRVGFVISQNDYVESAVETCEKAMKLIRISMEK